MKFNSKATLTSVNVNKEGNSDQDLPNGLGLKLKQTCGSTLIVRAMSGSDDINALNQSFWNEDGTQKYFSLTSMSINKSVEGCSFVIDDHNELKADNAKIDNFVVNPTNEIGVWEMTYKVYISDPKDELIIHCCHKLKGQVKVSVDKKQEELPV